MGLNICLFLSGVLFICDGLHVLGPSDPLIVELGGSVMLPCYVEAPLPLEELEVEWKGADSGTLVHLFQDGESRPEAQNQAYSGRASFFTEEVERGNFSLLLTNLTTKDAGIYNCSVYSQQETGQTSVEIKEIEYLIVTGGHVVSAYVGEDITMNCSVDSHIPPEKLDEVSWKKVDQQIQVLIFLNGEVQPESTHERYADRVELFSREEIQKGNFSFRLKDLRTEDKGQYICEAFFGEFADNTTVEVQQLGFSSMHTGILLLCIIAFVVPVVLGYPAYVSLKRNDNSKRALAVQYTLVCCSNIALCLAFILWGVIEGFLTEAATCSAINLLRILFLFWIAPYLDTFKAILQRFIKRSAITLEYAVIAAFAYSGFIVRLWHNYQQTKNIVRLGIIIVLLSLPFLLCINIFVQGLTKIFKQEQTNYILTELINGARGCYVVLTYGVNISKLVLFILPFLEMIFVYFRCQCLFNRGSRVLIRMSVLLILEIVCASSSVYIHYDLLDTLDFRKERDGLTCLAAYLYVLTGMLLFKVVIDDYGLFSRRPHSNRTRQVVESSTVTGTQRTSGHAIVYMLGAVGLSCVNSVALAVELILKARNGERTVNDLRVILVPFECIFPIGCLVLQISAFCKYNLQTRHRL
ncbi:uncharacterized protein LOC108431415 isoform X1 [Pygocentrus nattereri]|uniref:uncharacterized protein LOC108431415 isoform X1 n=1 Tax=Pygocentrus nattereri TaxID=42514 RepID=UPI001891B9AF|nr:uncharacterized protein LOC108431415 isoform X1 [Pygocentrus nattereri]